MAFSVPAGANSIILTVGPLFDSTTGLAKAGITSSGITAYYTIDGESPTAIVLIPGSGGDDYLSGKWAELDAVNMTGEYALHFPDEMWSTSAIQTKLHIQATGIFPYTKEFSLNSASLTEMLESLLLEPTAPIANDVSGKVASTVAAGDIAIGAITSSVIAENAINASGLAADAAAEIGAAAASATLASTTDGVAISDILECVLAILGGNTTKVGNTITYMKRNGSTGRLSYSAVSGTRTSSTIL